MSLPSEQIVLTGQIRQRLLTAFVSAFGNWDKLEQMLLLEMGLKLETVVAREDMNTVVFKLLFNVMEARGELPDVVKAGCRHAPRNKELWDVATELGWAPDPADVSGEAAASVRTAFRALKELLRDPEISSKLQAFRVNFEGADQRIQIVGDYKDLHESLHDIQLLCYSPILSARRDFPQGQTADQLSMDSRKLNRLIRQLRVIVQRPTLDASDFIWIEEQLEPARLDLNGAIAALSSTKLDDSIELLTAVMQQQPSIINSLLRGAVRDLDLPRLQSRLEQVTISLQTLGASPSELQWFQKGVAQLGVLDAELKATVSNHRAWQAVDNNLRLVEGALNEEIEEIEKSWRILETKLTLACDGATDDWAKDIEEARSLLQDAIAKRSFSSIFDCFKELQTLAIDRFYKVDKEMKDLCEKLRPLGDELKAILEVME